MCCLQKRQLPVANSIRLVIRGLIKTPNLNELIQTQTIFGCLVLLQMTSLEAERAGSSLGANPKRFPKLPIIKKKGGPA